MGVKSKRLALRQAMITSLGTPMLAFCIMTVLRCAAAGLSLLHVDSEKAIVVHDGKADPHIIR